jgi:hypothetical protein
MSSNKLFGIGAVIFIILLIVLVYMCLSKKKHTVEPFIDVPQSYYLEHKLGNENNPMYDLTPSLVGPFDDKMFMSRPEFRANIPPRFYSGSYASEIAGPMPPTYLQATPKNPTDFEQEVASLENRSVNFGSDMSQGMVAFEKGNDIKEKFNIPSSEKQNFGNLSQGQVDEMIKEKYINPLEYVDPSEILPSDDMSSVKYGKKASDPETFVYDRLIYANQKRRNLYGADWIRGDLPIVPIKHGNYEAWFQPSAKPHLDLRVGAMQFIGPDYTSEVEREDLMVRSTLSDQDYDVVRFH